MDRTGVTKPHVYVCHSKDLLTEESGDLIARLSRQAIEYCPPLKPSSLARSLFLYSSSQQILSFNH
jgi:hypothetical protein